IAKIDTWVYFLFDTAFETVVASRSMSCQGLQSRLQAQAYRPGCSPCAIVGGISYAEEICLSEACVHADRAVSCHRDHRGSDCIALAGGSVGSRSRSQGPMHQQPETDWSGLPQLS